MREVIIIALPKTFRGATHVGFRINGITSDGLVMEGRYGKLLQAGFTVDPHLAHWDRRLHGREYREGLVATAKAQAEEAGASDLADVDWRRSDVATHLLAWGLKDGVAWDEAHPPVEPSEE